MTEVNDYATDEESPEQIRTANADPQQEAQNWLGGLAGLSDETKDVVFKALWDNKDFQSA